MKKTRWYCDRCDKEFYTASRLIPVEVSIGHTYSDDYRREKREFCKNCFQEVRNQLLAVMMRKEVESDEE